MSWRQSLIRAGLFLAAGLMVLLLVTTYFIEKEVQGTCRTATALYPGDRIHAVISLARREDISVKERAKALWALGQLGDKEALGFLRSRYGNRCGDDLCTYKAQFAIKQLEEGRFNLPGFLWRKWLSG